VASRGACCKAVRMDIAKQVYYDDIRWKGLDGWFFKQCQKVKPNLKEYVEKSDYWKSGFNTHGFNNLSDDRTRKIANNSHKFLKFDVTQSTIPQDVIERLKTTKCNLGKHRLGDFE